MKYCPNCNKHIEDDAQRFCAVCGTPLIEKNICPKCNTENSPEYAFCIKCGTPLKQQTNLTKTTPFLSQNQTVAKDNSNNIKFVAIIIAILVIAGAGFYFLGNNNSKSSAVIPQKNTPDITAPKVTEEVKKEQIQYYPNIVDGAGLLEPEAKTRLRTFLQGVENKHNIRCAVLTVKTTQDMPIRQYAEAVQDKYYSDAKVGSILMVIDMEKKKWHITTDSRMMKIITDDMVMGSLKNAFINDLKQGNYASAIFEYGKKVDELMSK